MLQIKFWRIENTLFMQILEQGEEIKPYNFRFRASNNIEILSRESPQIGQNMLGNISENMLYIRGTDHYKDNSIVAHTFNSVTIAKHFFKKYVEAIKEYNISLSSQEQGKEDIETIVAE